MRVRTFRIRPYFLSKILKWKEGLYFLAKDGQVLKVYLIIQTIFKDRTEVKGLSKREFFTYSTETLFLIRTGCRPHLSQTQDFYSRLL